MAASEPKHVLVTGGAGFIGSHLCESLLRDKIAVTALDNFDPYYDRAIKDANLAAVRRTAKEAGMFDSFRFVEGDIRDKSAVGRIYRDAKNERLHTVHLAGFFSLDGGSRPEFH